MNIEGLKNEFWKRYIEYRMRMMRDGEVFIDCKGNFIDPEKVELKEEKNK